MQLPIVQVADLIEDHNFDWVDDVITSGFSPGEHPDVNQTQVLVQDGVGNMADHANDVFYTVDAVVEVQIFFSKKVKINVFDAKVAVMTLLQDNGWLTSTVRPDTTDPDTQQKTVTFYVTKNLRIRGN